MFQSHAELLQTKSDNQINNFIKTLQLQKSKMDPLSKNLLWIDVRKHFLVTRDQIWYRLPMATTTHPYPEVFKRLKSSATIEGLKDARLGILIMIPHYICLFGQ